MIRVTVLYPNDEGTTFDHEYYLDTHMPMVADRCGDALHQWTVDKGVAGGEPGAPSPHHALCQLTFDSVDSYESSFGPHADEIMGDIPNYTDAPVVVQISEVRR
jgi:uncharacterized protein (TIGR02118 family)